MCYLCLTLISRSYLVGQIRVGEHWAVKLTLVTDKEKSDYLNDPRKIHFYWQHSFEELSQPKLLRA